MIDGADLDRVLHLFAPTRISGVVIRNGFAPNIAGADDGGGILALANVTLTRSAVTANDAADNGQGIAAEGGSIALSRSSASNNLGQGVREEGDGSIVLKRSRVSGNDELGVQESGEGGVRLVRSRLIGNGGLAGIREFDDGGVSVVGTTISRNQGLGIEASGPGSSLVLNRARVSGNGGTGVLNVQPTARITRSTVAGNNGGGVFQYSGALHIARTRVVGNQANQDGGGISALSTASLRIDRTTVAGNGSMGAGGGISAISFPTTNPAVITRSTISGNSADGAGGGIYGDAKLTVTNSTVAKNQGGAGGGIFINGGTGSQLNAVSVVRNVADDDYGGGLYLANDAPLRVDNSLIALNKATCLGCGSPDCINEQDPFTSGGNNLLSTKENCGGFDEASDLERSNPKLGKLRDNGGLTKTVALKKGSPAVGKAGNDAPKRDQRGVKRDKQPDIGAFER